MTSPAPASRWNRRRIAPIVAITFIVVALIIALVVWIGQARLVGQVATISDAMPVTSDRPAPSDGKAKTILLLGSDKRDDGSIKGERSDTMMVARVAADRESVSIVSIPRDSWVTIPGHGKNKINAAFSLGGTALAVETIEKMSDVRIDYVSVIDWEGFKRLTDTLGGVTVTIPEKTYDAYRKKTWEKGTHELDGAETLLYVRQRAGLPGGDLDRVKRQQNVIRYLMGQTLSKETLANPVTLYKALDAITSNLEVDEGFTAGDMRSLAYSLKSLRADDIRFATIPVSGTGMVGAQSVVHLDDDQAEAMWEAFRQDEVAEWIEAQNRGLGTTVR